MKLAYDYLYEEYINKNRTIVSIAEEHNLSYWQVYSILDKYGLKKKLKPSRKGGLLKDEYPEIAKEWDTDNNDVIGLSIEHITSYSSKYAWWKCGTCGYEWRTTINNRTGKNSGCPKCNEGNQGSTREYAIYLCLEHSFNDILYQYKINNMSFDIFIPFLNTVIEYQGRYTHDNKYQRNYDVEKRDSDKREELKKRKIRLVTINETYNKGEAYIKEDGIYFNGDNRQLQSIVNEVIPLLSIILKTNICLVEDINTLVNSRLKLKDLNDSLGNRYLDLAKEWDVNKNGCLTPFKIKPQSNKKVWWKCSSCGHEWQTSPAHRVADKTGCPKCAAINRPGSGSHMVIAGVNDLITLRPDIAKEYAYDLNNIALENISIKSNRVVWWRCSECGCEFQDKVVFRTTRNHGCPNCKDNSIVL